MVARGLFRGWWAELTLDRERERLPVFQPQGHFQEGKMSPALAISMGLDSCLEKAQAFARAEARVRYG